METASENTTGGCRHELRTTLRRAAQVWRLVSTWDRAAFATAALIMAVTSACQVTVPLFLGWLIDDMQRGIDAKLAAPALGRLAAVDLAALAGAYLFREALHVVRRYLIESTCLRVEKETSVRLVSHLMKVDLATLTHRKVGALQGRIVRNVDGFVRFLRLSFLDFLPAISTGVFALAVTAGKAPGLGLLMIGVIPLALLLTLWQLASQKGVRLSLLGSKEALDGTVVELLSGLEYVRAAHTYRHELRRVEWVAEQRRRNELRHHFQMSLFGSSKALNEAFFHLVVLGGAVYFAVTGTISLGDVWTFSLLFLNVMTPLSEIHRILDEGHESSLQVGQLLELLAIPVDASFTPASIREPRLDGGAPAVVFEDVRVDYRTAEGGHKRALQGVSLAIRHGETLGVAGRSGGGKSTWLRVLLRLTHPCSGRAWLGGAPLESVSREAIGRLVGYVGQSPFVFAGTIAENIAYGSDSVAAAEIEQAARMACLHEDILAMPGGYQARVAERGQNLSGGQKQRIALARAFLKNPPILVLDEGTSALDTISERSIQRAIEAAREDRTIILVTHRLSTLRQTDRLAVFEGGRVVEAGHYRELVKRGGVLAELVRSAGEEAAIAWAEECSTGEGIGVRKSA